MWASQRSCRGTKLLSWCAGLSHESQRACTQSPDRKRKGIKSCHRESCGSPVSDVRNRGPRVHCFQTPLLVLCPNPSQASGTQELCSLRPSLCCYGCSRWKISGYRRVNVVHFFTLRKIVKDMRKPGIKPKNVCFFLPKENWTDKGAPVGFPDCGAWSTQVCHQLSKLIQLVCFITVHTFLLMKEKKSNVWARLSYIMWEAPGHPFPTLAAANSWEVSLWPHTASF